MKWPSPSEVGLLFAFLKCQGTTCFGSLRSENKMVEGSQLKLFESNFLTMGSRGFARHFSGYLNGKKHLDSYIIHASSELIKTSKPADQKLLFDGHPTALRLSIQLNDYPFQSKDQQPALELPGRRGQSQAVQKSRPESLIDGCLINKNIRKPSKNG